MNYISKAIIQNILSILPSDLANYIYYFIQKKFGSLKKLNHKKRLLISNKIFELAEKEKFITKNKKFLEIGTGRNILLPLGLWLKGANEIVTVDLNRYFDEKVFFQSLEWVVNNLDYLKEEIPDIDIDRVGLINSFINNSDKNINQFLDSINIKYLAPCDASNLPYKDGYFDFHISFTVLEHIDINSIELIFKEARRVLNNKGCLIHMIDYTDHFSHSDPGLSKISFLSYSEMKVNFLINNRFMYMNMLRHDDFIDFFEKNKFKILKQESIMDKDLLEKLNKDKNKFKFNKKYINKKNIFLATDSSWFVLR